MIEIFLLSSLNSIFYFSSGLFFTKKILDLEITEEQSNIFKFVLYGGIFLAFLGLLLNFFISLGKNVNTILLIISFIYLFTVKKKNNNKNFIIFPLNWVCLQYFNCVRKHISARRWFISFALYKCAK